MDAYDKLVNNSNGELIGLLFIARASSGGDRHDQVRILRAVSAEMLQKEWEGFTENHLTTLAELAFQISAHVMTAPENHTGLLTAADRMLYHSSRKFSCTFDRPTLGLLGQTKFSHEDGSVWVQQHLRRGGAPSEQHSGWFCGPFDVTCGSEAPILPSLGS